MENWKKKKKANNGRVEVVKNRTALVVTGGSLYLQVRLKSSKELKIWSRDIRLVLGVETSGSSFWWRQSSAPVCTLGAPLRRVLGSRRRQWMGGPQFLGVILYCREFCSSLSIHNGAQSHSSSQREHKNQSGQRWPHSLPR